MRKLLVITLFLGIFHAATAQTARDIVKKSDERARGKSSAAQVNIQIIRPGWSREMSMKSWSKGTDYSLVLILSPAKEKGIVFLKRQKEVWNWIPSIERNIKMPPSMMSQSWMGTDFTNDDLVKEASILEDYNHSFLAETNIDGKACHQILLIPKPNSAVVWGKIILNIDKKDLNMLHAEYYDEDGKLVNTMHCSEVKNLGGKMLPSRMEMVPAQKKGNKTVMIYSSISFDFPIEDDFFSIRNINKIK